MPHWNLKVAILSFQKENAHVCPVAEGSQHSFKQGTRPSIKYLRKLFSHVENKHFAKGFTHCTRGRLASGQSGPLVYERVQGGSRSGKTPAGLVFS